MEETPASIRPAIVGILTAQNEVMGAGFLASQTHILTCAHVIKEAIGQQHDAPPPVDTRITVQFALLPDKPTVITFVEYWNRENDIAVLTLYRTELPDEAKPVRLLQSDSFWNHPFGAFGFAKGTNGVWATGQLTDIDSNGRLQLQSSDSQGYEVQSGFSGTAVWDETLKGVIGMITTAHRPKRAGYAILADKLLKAVPPAPQCDLAPVVDLNTPNGTIAFDDPLYIRRPNDDELEAALLKKGGNIVTIRAPRQSGKSSLLVRGLAHARATGSPTVLFDLQRRTIPIELADFLRDIGQTIARAVNRHLRIQLPSINDVWDDHLGAQQNLSYYLEDEILPLLDRPLVLGIDEADELLQCGYSSDFFGLLRAWHNQAANEPLWRKLNLLLVISTEPHLLIRNMHQSPFNVGLKLYLDGFTRAQVASLNDLHGTPLQSADFDSFMHEFEGHPYLVRQALYSLVMKRCGWAQLRDTATQYGSPFSEHLYHLYALLDQDLALKQAVIRVIRDGRCDDQHALFRLQKAGVLVTVSADLYRCRCGLYHRYLQGALR